MTKWLLRLVALAMFLFAGTSFAQELKPLPGTPSADGPTAILPGDVPVMSAAHAEIPPIPSSYVTKDLGWMKLSYPASAKERVAPIEAEAAMMKSEIASAFELPVLERVEVRIAPTLGDMSRLAPVNNPPPQYASGVAYPRLRLILLSMLEPRGAEAVDLPEVLRHELVHVALEEAVGGQHVPVWFNEGLAISLSGEKRWDRMQVLVKAALSGTLIPLSDLDRRFPSENFEVSIAYAESADFVRFLNQRSDHQRFVSMINRVREGDTFERALGDSYNSDVRKLEFQWRGEVERRYSIWPVLGGGGAIWGVVMVVLVMAYVKKKRRAKKILEKWGREEAFEDAMIARAAQAANDELVAVAVLPSVKIMADDGHIHTLH